MITTHLVAFGFTPGATPYVPTNPGGFSGYHPVGPYALLDGFSPSETPPPDDDIATSSGRAAASTSWNPKWSEQYGPAARQARLDAQQVTKAIQTIERAEYLPPGLETAKEIVHSRSLVDELTTGLADTDEKVTRVLEAYFVLVEWRRRDDEEAAAILLLL